METLKQTCSECPERLQRQRGCGKVAAPIGQPVVAHRFTSPLMAKDAPLYECPTGYILRTAPWVWDAIDMAGAAIEHCGPTELGTLPRFTRHVTRLVGSERERMRRVKESQKQAEGDAKWGASVRARRG